MRCWGVAGNGQLGLGNSVEIGATNHPADFPPVVFTEVEDLSAGAIHNCFLRPGGAVHCFGGNYDGQLGLGHTNEIGDSESPDVGPIGLGAPAIDVDAGGHHTCAVLQGGAVRCWGDNNRGQLGLGHTNDIGDDELPLTVPPVQLGGPAVRVSAGNQHTCALMATGQVRCWGYGDGGRLGYANEELDRRRRAPRGRRRRPGVLRPGKPGRWRRTGTARAHAGVGAVHLDGRVVASVVVGGLLQRIDRRSTALAGRRSYAPDVLHQRGAQGAVRVEDRKAWIGGRGGEGVDLAGRDERALLLAALVGQRITRVPRASSRVVSSGVNAAACTSSCGGRGAACQVSSTRRCTATAPRFREIRAMWPAREDQTAAVG
jgi:hypothetical protein